MAIPRYPLNEWFAKGEGRFDVSLSSSSCQPLAIGDLMDVDELRALSTIPLSYGPFAGSVELQSQIATQYQTIAPSDILTYHGPGEAIYTVLQGLLEAGDQVAVQSPGFHPLAAIPRHIGCEVHAWNAADPATCLFEVDDLATVCSRKTKLIIINFPHWPSGQMISESDLYQIVDIAKSADAIILSDESFRLLELPPHATLPAVCDIYNQGVSLTGLSKPYGLGGLRIGWVATRSSPLRESLQQYRFYTSEITNTPCQWIGSRAIKKTNEIVARNRQLIATNLERLTDFVRTHHDKLRMHPPSAGTMAVVEQSTGMMSTEFCERALDEFRLFMIPGSAMGMSDRLLRFGLGMSDFDTGLERLNAYLRTLS